ncbi:MAG TPA: hypothetical protein VJ044_17105 [Candidatus Hodarchaeales archaeon]|nr:hypothetical protein [Candidatus Hodarchaeales archaeon]
MILFKIIVTNFIIATLFLSLSYQGPLDKIVFKMEADKKNGSRYFSVFRDDFNGSLSEQQQFHEYLGNSHNISNGILTIDAKAHSYGHLSHNLSINPSMIDLRLRHVIGELGESWGPGIGVYWNTSSSIFYNLAKSGTQYYIFFVYYHYAKYSACNMSIAPTGWLDLRMILDGSVSLLFRQNLETWIEFSCGNLLPMGITMSQVIIPHLEENSSILIIGKGLMEGSLDTSSSDEFDTIYQYGTGTKGTTEIDSYEVFRLEDDSSATTSSISSQTTPAVLSNSSFAPSALSSQESNPSIIISTVAMELFPGLLITLVAPVIRVRRRQ